MQTYVIYHRADFDGIFCREIAKKFLPNSTLIPWDYGEPTPKIPLDAMLYILDLSVPDLMNHPHLIWIDHHKSAIEKYDPSIVGYRIDGVAACRLAWQWFNFERSPANPHCHPADYCLPLKEHFTDRKVVEPWAVRLAGEYDIWDKRDPGAELFQHGLRSEDIHFQTLLKDGTNAHIYVQSLLGKGRAIQYAKTKENEGIIKSAGYTRNWEGIRFLVCSHARFNSYLFKAGLEDHHDACLGFTYNGLVWKISLYHAPGKEHIDLSQIAVKYGGGGHRGACGFTIKELPKELL